jgi:hypothetical protein
LPDDGGEFLPFLIEYRTIIEGGSGEIDDLANRYSQYRRLLFPPLRTMRKKRAEKPVAPALTISILDYAEIPGSKDQFHFNFEFHCSECGGYLISTPDREDELIRCTACGVAFDTLAKINEVCQTVALDELRVRKLGAFRDTRPAPEISSVPAACAPRSYRLEGVDEVFGDIIAGWEMSVTMQLRTPLNWLQRHREFHEGRQRPAEKLPPECACWVPVGKSWRDLGIDMDEVPESTMASQIGQIPVDGGEFLPFLLEYRMIFEDGGGTLDDLASRYPQHRDLIFPPARRKQRRRKVDKI